MDLLLHDFEKVILGIRETREECGPQIPSSTRLDELVYFAQEQKHYRKRCVFFTARVTAEISRQLGQIIKLVWSPSSEALTRLTLESQRWAVSGERARHPT